MMDEAWKKYFDPQVLERLRGHRLRLRRSAEGTLIGAHRSPRAGQAVEFSEYRQYTPGDDLRGLDWKVLGRTDKYYLRQREDETTLDCHFIVDISGSMAFQGPEVDSNKLVYALRTIAGLAYVAIEAHDRISFTAVGQQVDFCLSLGGGAGQLMGLAAAMDGMQCEESSEGDSIDISERMAEAGQHSSKGSLLVLVGDFFDPVPALLRTLRALRAASRSVIVVQVIDPAEADFPYRDALEFAGLEEPIRLAADARGIAGAYRLQFQQHQRELAEACLGNGVPLWSLRTDQPLGYRLAELLETL